MSADIPGESDCSYDVVDNVSYSTTPKYAELNKITAKSVPVYTVLKKVAATTKKTEQSLHKESFSSASCTTTINVTESGKKEDFPKRKKCGVLLICLIALLVIALFIAAGIALILGFVEISKLHSEVAQLRLTSPRLFMNIQELESTINAQFNNFDTKLNATEENNKVQDLIIFEFLSEVGYALISCATILQYFPSSPSGYYYIRSLNSSAVRVYCDMTRSCGNITGGWMRVAELDMTDTTTQCPSSLQLLTSPRRSCRTINSASGLCSSDTFAVYGVEYSNVCGRIIAYQFGTPDAFGDTGRDTDNPNIETYYVDGVSLTYGMSPRKHIWTFVGANREDDRNPMRKCSCINTNISSLVPPVPSFVGEDYFCDTAAVSSTAYSFYTDDPLWDGAGCGPQNTCCSVNNPPWFYKQLPQTTTDDVEMRVCRDQGRFDEDIAIAVVEIYVQ